MKGLSALLLLPHIRVQNVNMISGPLTWGFPSMTAFLGAAHKIYRDMRLPVEISDVGIVCHSFQPQISFNKNAGYNVAHLRRHPLKKNGKPASTIPEARAHIDISLVLGIAGELEAESEGPQLAVAIQKYVQGMRIAGGSVLPFKTGDKAVWEILSNDIKGQSESFRLFRKRLLPGFALVERRDKLREHLSRLREEDPETDCLEALLDLCRLNWEATPDPEDPDKGIWTFRKHEGWLAPISVGFRALSPLYEPGIIKNARDRETSFRFVENIYTLGEWKGPHRLDLPEFMWRYHVDEKKGLYICTQSQGDF